MEIILLTNRNKCDKLIDRIKRQETERMKKILIILNYYYPYVSGVSEYARILAQELVQNGHEVTVLTSNHAALKAEEWINGVKVLRTPVICKISKGTISPSFITRAVRLAKDADVVNMHLPMIESGIISRGIDTGKLLVTYHCDIQLPRTILNRLIMGCMDISNNSCLKKSARIAVQTKDYAEHSRVAYRYRKKFVETATPIKEYSRKSVIREAGKKVIGFCGRLVEEKGIDVLLKAYEILCREEDDLLLKIAGDHKAVAGGSIYAALKHYIEEHHMENVIFTGKLKEEEMEAFYSSLDVFVLPSINSLEAFGMVQIEAMYCGTPVVTTDLYGVRTIVKRTGMGVVVERNNADALADGLREVLRHRESYIRPKETIQQYYGTAHCVSVYERMMNEMSEGI